jgi:hypothetical protein
MKALHILDPKLADLNGHYYNYDKMLAAAAEKHFDQVRVYASEKFAGKDPQILPRLPALPHMH